MLVIDWDTEKGWHAPQITPYEDLKLSPATVALHYGIQVGVPALLTLYYQMRFIPMFSIVPL